MKRFVNKIQIKQNVSYEICFMAHTLGMNVFRSTTSPLTSEVSCYGSVALFFFKPDTSVNLLVQKREEKEGEKIGDLMTHALYTNPYFHSTPWETDL